MAWDLLLSAALEVSLGLIASVGFEEEVRQLKEAWLHTTEKKRRRALEAAVDTAVKSTNFSAISPLLHEAWFQEEIVTALLDPVHGFDVNKVAEKWESQLPSSHKLELRRFFTRLETILLGDDAWGPILQRFQELRFRQDVAAALETRNPLAADTERIVREVRVELTGSGGVAVEGGVAAGEEGLAVGENYGQIVQIIIQKLIVSGEVEKQADHQRAYLSELARENNILPWSRIFNEYADPNKGVTFGLEDVYTALDTTEMEAVQEETAYRALLADIRAAKKERISAIDMLNRHPRLLLMGDPGSGKSTFTKFVAYVLAQARLADNPQSWLERLQGWQHGPMLPIRIELRELAAYAREHGIKTGNVALFNRYLRHLLSEWEVAQFADELFQIIRKDEGNVLFLLDGLDEVPTSQRQLVVDMVNKLQERRKKQRYLVTCRPYAYIGQVWRLIDFKEATLAPFSSEQIAQFTRNWYAQLEKLGRLSKKEAEKGAKDIQKEIRRLHLEYLAENPLLLTAMTHLHVTKHKLPEDRVGLYDEIVNLLFDRWEGKRASENLFEQLGISSTQRGNLLKGLSFVAFQAHSIQTDEEEGDLTAADIPAEALANWLSPYFGGSKDKAESFVTYIRERAGLLIRHKTEAYTFPHRTFQEFLAARYLATLSEKDIFAEVERLARENLEHWREVLILLAGYLRSQGRNSQAIHVVHQLMPYDLTSMPKETNWWERSIIAARGLIEIGQAVVEQEDTGKAARSRLQAILQAMMTDDAAFAAKKRVQAGKLLGELDDPRSQVTDPLHIEWIEVPMGPFTMGTRRENLPHYPGENIRKLLEQETPQHDCHLPYPYRISRFPITVAQFQAFVGDGGYKEESYWPEARAAGLWEKGEIHLYTWNMEKGEFEEGWVKEPADYGKPYNLPNHPQVGVSWYEALAFTRWLTEHLQREGVLAEGWRVTLPSEAEWEKAARGADALIYPWGNEPDPNRANYDDAGIGTTSAVGCFPGGASPYGVEEMSGNVWEWTRSLWGREPWESEFSYPYRFDDNREKLNAEPHYGRVLRGGSFDDGGYYVRAAVRYRGHPDYRSSNVGFRVVLLPPFPFDL